MIQTIVYAGSSDSPWQDAFDRLATDNRSIDLVSVPNTKKALKYFRKHTNTAVIAVEADNDSLPALAKFSSSIREAMHNKSVRIVVCAEEPISGTELVKNLGVNAVIETGSGMQNRLQTQITAELNTHALILATQTKHDAETGLLSAIARFSRLEMKLSECLSELACSTGVLTGAAMVSVIIVRRDGQLKRSRVSYQAEGIDAALWLSENHTPDDALLRQVVEEARLQLQIQPDNREHLATSAALGTEITGRFVFPLRSFGRTMCLIECWLPAESLSLVSVELVRLIEKSSEQFSLLFERNQADKQLKRQYKRLKFTLEELSSAKNALYHTEKLASIGQLAAGIAHEINNPVAYVMGNFNPLNEYVDSMSQMLELHNKFVSMIDQADVSIGTELRQQINKTGADLDIDYVLEDVRELVGESRNGLKRVREIIVNLNQFARQDSINSAPTNLHDDIESTLKILRNELKNSISVKKDFGELPPVICQSGLIKQVLLNLIKNGVQAMGGKGKIKLRTTVESEQAVIYIRDYGSGIPEDALNKIFDPFFTTKPVGEGTGLGLSLSHGIIERHQGALEVVHTGADGTEFRLALPINGQGAETTDLAA